MFGLKTRYKKARMLEQYKALMEQSCELTYKDPRQSMLLSHQARRVLDKIEMLP